MLCCAVQNALREWSAKRERNERIIDGIFISFVSRRRICFHYPVCILRLRTHEKSIKATKKERKKLIQSHQLSDPKNTADNLTLGPADIFYVQKKGMNTMKVKTCEKRVAQVACRAKKETIIIIKLPSHWISYYREKRCDLINAPIQWMRIQWPSANDTATHSINRNVIMNITEILTQSSLTDWTILENHSKK